jgi:hypothetical protein
MTARVAKLCVALAATTAALVGFQPVLGQGSDTATADLTECVELESPEARFACYEARRSAVLEERERAAAAPAPAEEAAETDAGHADSSAPTGADAKAEVLATITALRQTVPNSYVITLDNGQVWRQMQPKWYPLRVGHQVRIRSTQWGGSYRLSLVGMSGFIQVERAR